MRLRFPPLILLTSPFRRVRNVLLVLPPSLQIEFLHLQSCILTLILDTTDLKRHKLHQLLKCPVNLPSAQLTSEDKLLPLTLGLLPFVVKHLPTDLLVYPVHHKSTVLFGQLPQSHQDALLLAPQICRKQDPDETFPLQCHSMFLITKYARVLIAYSGHATDFVDDEKLHVAISQSVLPSVQ